MPNICVYYGDVTELQALQADSVYTQKTEKKQAPQQIHLWMRKLLAQALSVPAQELVFTYGENGKPALAWHRLSFNLTHTRNAFALAMSHDLPALGIDIESSERQLRNPAAFAEACLDPVTLKNWKQLPATEQMACLLRHWVRREATVKATGAGLAQRWSDTFPAGTATPPAKEEISCSHYQLGSYHLALAWPAANNKKPAISWRALGSEWPVLIP